MSPETDPSAEEMRRVSRRQEEVVELAHRQDTLLLFFYLCILTLMIVTVWILHHRRLRFVHETTLAIIYGVIIGAIIRYTKLFDANDDSEKYYLLLNMPPPQNSSYNRGQLPPRMVILQMIFAPTSSIKYSYNFQGLVHQDIVDNRTDDADIENELKLSDRATFNPEIFFNLLLPPIIFYAGYSMKRHHFFRNIGAILTYALVGTALSSLVTGTVCWLFGFLVQWSDSTSGLALNFDDCLHFGSIVSATDPVTVLAIFNALNVDVDLYALVFGEAVLNDAVAIVLAQSIQKYGASIRDVDSSQARGLGPTYPATSPPGSSGLDVTVGTRLSAVGVAILYFLLVFFGGFFIGFVGGVVTALITKFTKLRDHPLLETALFCLTSYATFLLSESLGVIGIVAVLFCGIIQAHYSYNNLSVESKYRTRQIFELLNFLAENFVFAYMGISVITFRHHYWNVWFVIGAFVAILVGRAANIFPLSALLNIGRTHKISYQYQLVLMLAGLRGAMAFALAIRNTSSYVFRLFFSTTLVIVIVTIVFSGVTFEFFLKRLNIRLGVNERPDPPQNTPTHPPNSQTPDPTNPFATTLTEQVPVPGTADAVGPGAERQFKKAHMFRYWSKFDSHFMKPLLTHSRPCLVETLPHWLFYVARFFTSEEQLFAAINEREPRLHGANGVPTSIKFSELTDEAGFQEPGSSALFGGEGESANGGGSSGTARLRLSALHMNFGSLDLNETGIFSPPGSRPHGTGATPGTETPERREPSADSQLMDVTLEAPAASDSTSASAAASAPDDTKSLAHTAHSVGLDDPHV